MLVIMNTRNPLTWVHFSEEKLLGMGPLFQNVQNFECLTLKKKKETFIFEKNPWKWVPFLAKMTLRKGYKGFEVPAAGITVYFQLLKI